MAWQSDDQSEVGFAVLGDVKKAQARFWKTSRAFTGVEVGLKVKLSIPVSVL